ncbi:hypothetical protein RDI58_007899 [Solanum bulbocastanum]|uniref:F-box/LRR-repeat protein n=1 Tax=Solanum bulbocastanum TaxID=147425 RepID=A0AAN8TZL4_SOLBU
MEEGYSPVRKWEDLDNDILVKIFQSFDLFELSAGLAHNLKEALCDDSPSQEKLTRVLNICLNLSCGNIQILILHHNFYVNDNQLTFTAERCPRLKRLVMPSWNKIKSKQYAGLFIYGKILNH